LVEELGLTSLHQRTVRRDLDALQAAGIDVADEDSSRGKLWKLGPGVRGTHKVTASATELIALSLSRDLLYPLAGTPFWLGIESFWSKLRDQLPDAVWDHYEAYREVLFVRGMPAKSYKQQHGTLQTLHRCIQEHRVAEIEYQPIGKDARRRRIEPYAVVFYQSSLYILAAACEIAAGRPDRIRHWKLDRFLRAAALDEWFKVPADFDLEEHLGQSLGIFAAAGKPRDFRIRISARAAPWVQQTERAADGSLMLTVKAAHELEIIPRVLSLGNEAEVVSPASCRRTIARMIRAMAGHYADVPVETGT
jgi:predicted DNA-binding transcriptional regulator YafY